MTIRAMSRRCGNGRFLKSSHDGPGKNSFQIIDALAGSAYRPMLYHRKWRRDAHSQMLSSLIQQLVHFRLQFEKFLLIQHGLSPWFSRNACRSCRPNAARRSWRARRLASVPTGSLGSSCAGGNNASSLACDEWPRRGCRTSRPKSHALAPSARTVETRRSSHNRGCGALCQSSLFGSFKSVSVSASSLSSLSFSQT